MNTARCGYYTSYSIHTGLNEGVPIIGILKSIKLLPSVYEQILLQ